MCQLKKELEDNDRSTTDGTVYNLPEYEANVTPSAKQKPIQRVSIVFKSNQKPSVNTKVTSEANPQSPNSSNTVNSPKISESKVTESTNVLPRAVNQKEQPTKNVILPSRKCSQPKIINIKEDRTNTRPLNKYAKTYELEKFEKKLLIIINQYEIIGYKEPRWGTEKDVSALTNTFPKFGFQIELHEEKTVSEVSTLLGTFDHRNFSEYGCVAIVVLTHGTKGGYLHAKDGLYHEYLLLNAFKTQDRPSLVTKPKLLIIQACRGEQSVEGVSVGTPSTIKRDSTSFEPYLLPGETDIYVLHSSYDGKPSHRDIFDGTWLIQTLCKKINELAPTHDLASIVTEVKQVVAVDFCFEEYNTETLKMETNTQVPVDTSSLIRKLYFRKYGEAPISGIPTTPDIGLEKCSCFKDYFAYIRTCLRLHLKQNPGDAITEYFITALESLESCSDTSDKEKIT